MNFWAMPLEKPTRGKLVQEKFFLLSSQENFGFTATINSSLITPTISPRKMCQRPRKSDYKISAQISVVQPEWHSLLDNKTSRNLCTASFCTNSSSARHLENCVKTVLKWLPRFLCLEQLYALLNPYCTDCHLMLKMSWDACLLHSLEFVSILFCCYSFLQLKLSWSLSEYE